MYERPRNGGSAEYPSAVPFAATVTRVRETIAKANLHIFAEIDHAGGAHDAGLSMAPSIVIIYGSPAGGTPIMLAAPAAALDLPLRVLIRERADGVAVIAFHPAEKMLREDGVPADLADRLTGAQEMLRSAISSV